jgi:hypothetical protein
MTLNKTKIVVFDMDETLGYFVELGIFWDSLHNYARHIKVDPLNIFTQEYFNSVLDIFPEFIRPNILLLLQFVKLKKISKQCKSVIIYTNNQGPTEWAFFIKKYFENKLKYKLFSGIISAFKINGKQIEICRTTHDKTLQDLKRCSNIDENVEICYLDDTYHPGMKGDNVYYIKIKPYIHDLNFDVMIHRYMNSSISKKLIFNKNDGDNFSEFMKNIMTNYEFVYSVKNKEEYDIDKIVTKKTITHLHLFFNKNKQNQNQKSHQHTIYKKTFKNRNYKSKTKKNRNST